MTMSNSTAVATREQHQDDDETQGGGKALAAWAGYGNLAPAARAAMDRNRDRRNVADMIGTTAWGAGLTHAGRLAMATWCMQRDVDPINEIDNVGGPYINSEYYLRKLGELRVRGIVADVKQRHIAADKRMAALAQDKDAPAEVKEAAKREHYERLALRIGHGVPEEAGAAHVTAIYLVGGGEPITGVKWGGNGTSVKQSRSGGGSAPNPIVENNPTLAVESQSVRRAMRQLAAQVPGALPDADEVEAELGELRETLRVDARTVPAAVAPRALAAPEYGADVGDEPVDVIVDEADHAYGDDEPGLALDDAWAVRGRDALAEGH